MENLSVCLRIIIIGILWWLVLTLGLRFIIMECYSFDIFWPNHWRDLITLWKAGWVVKAPKEIVFLCVLLLYLPVYFYVWYKLCHLKFIP